MLTRPHTAISLNSNTASEPSQAFSTYLEWETLVTPQKIEWCNPHSFPVHHCSCVRTQSSPTSVQVSSAFPRAFHCSLKMFFAYQDFTLPDKFPHCLQAIEISCPPAIGYKAAGWWGLSSCFIVTMFMRTVFWSLFFSLKNAFSIVLK